MREPLLREGETCWRLAEARRVSFLVDAEHYFGAVTDALESARERVFLIGWDFHAGMRLRRGEDELPLVDFLDDLVRRRKGLHVHVLEWDFTMLFASQRQLLPAFRFGARTHRRLHFALDGNHPTGASHHVKLAVVDDAVAFTGGLDLTACRWDTREHRPKDPRRSDPGFPDYEPFHDVGIALEGPAARALGEFARSRWASATGRHVKAARTGPSAWPTDLAPALRDVTVGVARTQPAFEDEPERREVEALHLASIRSARRSIYVENQYLTAARVGEALRERLREPDGPEVVIVLPERESGWLEAATLGVLRDGMLRRLREADRHGRLLVVHPVVPEAGRVNVHAKLMIVDDALVRIGSANLANRSMGLDTELDVAIEARDEPAVARPIAALRDDLLAEHLGSRPEAVRELHESTGSLVATVQELGRGPRTLRRLEPAPESTLPEWFSEVDVLDPERPIGFDALSDALLPDAMRQPAGRRTLARAGTAAGCVAGLVALWRFTPLAELLAPSDLAGLAEPLRTQALGPAAAVVGIALLGSLLFPISAAVIASAIVYGPVLGFVVALLGSQLSAWLSYGVGHLLWRDAVHRLMTPRVRRVSRYVAERGIWAVATVRLVPVAPFGVVNLAAGASHLRPRDFALGTFLGMIPGLLAMTLLTDRLKRAVTDPGWGSALVFVGLTGAVVLGARWARGRVEQADEGTPAAADGG